MKTHLGRTTTKITTSEIPKSIANFEIRSEIGHGGMGSVYLARQMPVGREVALKVLLISNHYDPEYVEARQRFEAEAKMVSLLEHDNIVTLYDYGLTDEVAFLAMQYIKGDSIESLIEKHKRKRLEFDKITEYAKQVCRGLSFAHSKGILHRDIKPQNILVVTESNKCLITDFGIAKIKSKDRITVDGIAIGTPEYMSPEQVEGKSLDPQTDIYSLGVLLYEMCVGKPPFYGGDPVSIAYRQVHEEPKMPSRYRHDIPEYLENIIMKALKKNKRERYKTVLEVLRDLDASSPYLESDTRTLSVRVLDFVHRYIIIFLLLTIALFLVVFATEIALYLMITAR